MNANKKQAKPDRNEFRVAPVQVFSFQRRRSRRELSAFICVHLRLNFF
jgi:hypothetical protein